MRKWLLALCSLVPLLAHAELPGTTAWRYDIPNGFRHYERAWGAYQLDQTARQYDAGDRVQAAPLDSSRLFSVYKLQPGTQLSRTFKLVSPADTTVTICVNATVRNPAELDGFLQGMQQAKARLANSACEPAVLNTRFNYPAQVSAIQTVSAKRAAQFIAVDTAERAAQAAVADTIVFEAPSSVMQFTAGAGTSSASQAILLQNTSGGPLSFVLKAFDGPFEVNLSGCEGLLPQGICQANVVYKPSETGRHQGHVSIAAAVGKSLTIRVAGTAQ